MAGLLADLYARRLTASLLATPFADNVFPHLVRIVVEHNASDFGRPLDEKALAAAEAALLDIDRFSRSASYTTLTAEVLDRLSTIGKLSPAIDSTVITARATEVLADLTARRIASFANEAAITAGARPYVALLVAESCVPGVHAPAML